MDQKITNNDFKSSLNLLAVKGKFGKGKVDFRFTLEEAMKAQMGNRGIFILFL
jgi:hypothetical protein